MTLSDNEIHVWSVALDLSAAACSHLNKILSAQERSRAAEFLRKNDQSRFIASHGLLRTILSLYLQHGAGELVMACNAFGKPELHGAGGNPSELNFNYSHASSHAVFAFARKRRVGIDVEHVEPDFAGDSIPERFFHPGEVSALRALPKACQSQAFFKCWTRKEAYIKARGEGFHIPLDSFDVSSDRVTPEADDRSRWALYSFEPLPGYVVGVAGEGWDWGITVIDQPQASLLPGAIRCNQPLAALNCTRRRSILTQTIHSEKAH